MHLARFTVEDALEFRGSIRDAHCELPRAFVQLHVQREHQVTHLVPAPVIAPPVVSVIIDDWSDVRHFGQPVDRFPRLAVADRCTKLVPQIRRQDAARGKRPGFDVVAQRAEAPRQAFELSGHTRQRDTGLVCSPLADPMPVADPFEVLRCLATLSTEPKLTAGSMPVAIFLNDHPARPPVRVVLWRPEIVVVDGDAQAPLRRIVLGLNFPRDVHVARPDLHRFARQPHEPFDVRLLRFAGISEYDHFPPPGRSERIHSAMHEQMIAVIVGKTFDGDSVFAAVWTDGRECGTRPLDGEGKLAARADDRPVLAQQARRHRAGLDQISAGKVHAEQRDQNHQTHDKFDHHAQAVIARRSGRRWMEGVWHHPSRNVATVRATPSYFIFQFAMSSHSRRVPLRNDYIEK